MLKWIGKVLVAIGRGIKAILTSPVFQGFCLIAGSFTFAIWIAPWLVVTTNKQGLTGDKLIAAENQIRGLAIQFLGGMALFIGAVTLWRHIQRNMDNAQMSQFTERFTKAVELLGSDKIETRLGGIYALERISRDSERDHWTIVETFTAFIRVHRTWRDFQDPSPVPEDIEVILQVLGRRPRTYGQGEAQPLELSGTDLRFGNFTNGHFEGAQFHRSQLDSTRMRGTFLTSADLVGVHFDEADLTGASLERADLSEATIRDSVLVRARLEYAKLIKTNFEGSNLGLAVLKGADARQASFERADLSGADFTGVNLRMANIYDADLDHTILIGADLRNVRGMTHDQLHHAIIDQTTLLPDYLQPCSLLK